VLLSSISINELPPRRKDCKSTAFARSSRVYPSFF
jgi:hypothetical protein